MRTCRRHRRRTTRIPKTTDGSNYIGVNTLVSGGRAQSTTIVVTLSAERTCSVRVLRRSDVNDIRSPLDVLDCLSERTTLDGKRVYKASMRVLTWWNPYGFRSVLSSKTMPNHIGRHTPASLGQWFFQRLWPAFFIVHFRDPRQHVLSAVKSKKKWKLLNVIVGIYAITKVLLQLNN